LHFSLPPSSLTDAAARFNMSLAPRDEVVIQLTVNCRQGHSASQPRTFEQARTEAGADRERYHSWCCHVQTSNDQFNAWISRAASDLHMLTTELPTGPYPYAGVPWFNTPFGRDGIITALECLWLRPGLAKGVLKYLASTQATEVVAAEDAEPGKILHETRIGEMAALKEMPFGRYYGGVDSTPLFVLLAAAYLRRTGDRAFVETIWPNVEAALNWIEVYGDRDKDGFVEYARQSSDGLIQQGWKDSDDSIFHVDGTLARAPIALCEVQGYAYAAWRAGSLLARTLGRGDLADRFTQCAENLRTRFLERFWCEDMGTYALALDGEKRPCRVRASNAGQCLFTGIAAPDHARAIARELLTPESFSGWGIRTVASSEARYNPMAYHNGTIWPHDNALIALGLSRYGLSETAVPILSGLFEAGLHFDLNRMPELFCGFPQSHGEGPIHYPVACAPQAWAAASVFLLIQACLGLEVDGLEREVVFSNPQLPEYLPEVRIHNLEVAGAAVDLLLIRNKHDVGVNVLRREGNVRITVVK
jgi:glycogen debranching enzyme